MSKSEELLRLERDLNEQPELKEKLEAELKRIVEAGEAKCDGEAMVKAAASVGYTITVEELDRAAADLEKLDDDELDSVAGGRSAGDGSDGKCVLQYTCGRVFFRDDVNACSKQAYTSGWFDCPKLAKKNPEDTGTLEERELVMMPGWVPKD